MKRTQRLRLSPGLSLCLAVLCAFATIPAEAQEASLEGEVLIGFRSVDVGGAERKYKEDYNLEDGPRLFDLALHYTPEPGTESLVDQLDIELVNFGGDPFETLHFGMRKVGTYDFTYDRRKSDYFYEDIILPPDQANVRLSTGGDFHHYNFERVRDTAQLDLTLSQRASFSLGFDRYAKLGESTTSLDISRDEFELEKPIDETLDRYSVGFQYAWDKVTLILDERYHDYSNLYEIFLPGFSLGESVDDSTTLDFFFLDQPYDYTAYEHTVRVIAQPNQRFRVQVAASLQTLDLDVDASERSQGVSFRGSPFTTDLTGTGEIERDIDLFDIELAYQVNDRVVLVGSAWSRELDQTGRFVFGDDDNRGDWNIDTTGAEAGVEFQPSSDLALGVGARFEDRDVVHGSSEHDPSTEVTDSTGYYANVAWRPSQRFSLTARFEDSSIDDPFALAVPTDRQRLRLRGRYRLDNGLSVSATYLGYRTDNKDSGWQADTDQFGLRFGYQRDGIQASLGYASLENDRRIDQLVLGNILPIDFVFDADLIDALLRWQANDRWTLGTECRFYENSGSFGLDRSDVRGWVEAGIGDGYVARIGLRVIDYDETDFDFDDYDADILEVGFGYRWGR